MQYGLMADTDKTE